MAQRWMKAADTFVAMLDDGTQAFVTKGDTLPDSHELVKRDQQGSGALFRPLDAGEEEAPPKSGPAKAEAQAPVKAAPRTSGKAS
jgi:hypothetical protein